VSVTRRDAYVTLHVNGKPDGSAREGEGTPSPDEITMTLLGALPLIYAPQARQVAVIGFGTGISSQVLLASPRLQGLDTIEIEPAVVRAAERFRPRNARAYDDPRSQVHYEDAKTYFASRRQLYDVIVSEPSNPWVSGVATLFSAEFYREVHRRLAPGGLLVQWLQVYEMTPQVLASVLEALSREFPHYVLWTSNHFDLIVVAARDGMVPEPQAAALQYPALGAELGRFSIHTMDDLRLHRLAGRDAIGPYFSTLGAPVNTDFEPYVDLNAAKARFMRRAVSDLDLLREAPLPLLDRFEKPRALRPDPARLSPGARPWLRYARLSERAAAVSSYLHSGDVATLELIGSPLADDALTVRGATVTCALQVPLPLLRDALIRLAGAVNPHLTPTAAEPLWAGLQRSKCAAAGRQPIRAWLALHRALAADSPEGLAQAAEAVLETDHSLPATQLPYVVAALMSGQIQRGERDAAWRTFSRYRSRLNVEPGWQQVFGFLVAHADAPLLK
jgi:hypothetical protein